MSNGKHSGYPPHWDVRQSKSRQIPYYFNTLTGESRWDPPSPSEGVEEDSKLGAMHILVKHSKSRNPSSWREKNITLTEQEAYDKINSILQRLTSKEKPESFKDVAAVESDCSSAKRGGDLGLFPKGAMQKPFEDAVLGLKVGKLSGPIKTDSGIHLVLRTK
ncbi:Peptidyl-prolyl cis-trans isomerase NIMA-interacting protein 1 [Coemansia sp. RSA 988]|nr:Peptidyl-prolyl cis-trans isomerase NIMA-interacting protein 1 [Coemansia sp. RSA 988]